MGAEAKHYWILVLDVESFSKRTDPVQRSVRAAMYDVLDEALAHADVEPSDVVAEDRGDGVLMLISSAVPPVKLAGGLIRALNDGLAEKAVMHSAAHALRFRVALHQGLATPDERGWSGDAVNMACRLVDAQPLRDVLKAASEAHLAFITSDEVYQSVIRHGYRTVDPAAYRPLRFGIKGGSELTGWVMVPGLSAPPGLREAATLGDDRSAGDTEPGATPQTSAPGTAAAEQHAPGSRQVTFNIQTAHGDSVAGDKTVTVHPQGPVRP